MSFVFNPFTSQLDRVLNLSIQEVARRLEITLIADETISALNAVIQNSDTTCEKADVSSFESANCVGVALNAGNVGEVIRIHIFGNLEDNFFSFSANEPIYLSDTTPGLITNVAPVNGFSCLLGQGLGAGAIFVNIQDPIEL